MATVAFIAIENGSLKPKLYRAALGNAARGKEVSGKRAAPLASGPRASIPITLSFILLCF
jgi:hypothetical protein